MSKFNGWKIYAGKWFITTVYYLSNITAEEVRKSLIDHDRYPQNIRVKKERT